MRATAIGNSARLLGRPGRIAVIVLALIAGVVAAPQAEAGAQIPGKVYFLMADGSGATLVPVARTVDATIPATTSMHALLRRPTADEAASTPGISTAIPAGTELHSVTIADGVATVDLSAQFVSGGGSASMRARLAQVVFTLTQFSTVDAVLFEIDGTPTTVFGGEGVIVDVPAARAEFEDQLPLLFVDSPAYGSKITNNRVRISGVANVFEATFWAALYDGDGRELARNVVMASSGSGEYGTFAVSIPYLSGEGVAGSVVVWESSAQDGSRINIREQAIRLGHGVRCAGRDATILGTGGDDIIYGTGRDDVIAALGGRDRVYAGGGDDVVCGGGGRDTLLGMAGDDLLIGNRSLDRLHGGPGHDIGLGGPGPDVCRHIEVTRSC